MAVELYLRSCVLKVGPPGGAGVRVEGLRIAFDVRKSLQSASNKARVQVWNLAEETRGAIRERHDALEIEAGYEGLSELLYAGEILHAAHPRSGPDVVTSLECGDGAESFRSAQLAKTFRRGERVVNVIEAAAKKLTEPIEDEPDDPLTWGPRPKPTKPSRVSLRGADADLTALEADLAAQGISTVLRRPLSVNGSAKDVLDSLGRTYRFDWSVQDGALQVVSYGRALTGEAVSLSPSSGLLGDPTPTEAGVKLVALLIPRIRPGAVLDLDSRAVKGKFRAEHVAFVGDTHSDTWTTEVEARALPGLV